MRLSSGIHDWMEGLAPLEHGPEYGEAAAGKRDDGLGVVFALAALPVVEGAGQRVVGGYGAEGALEEDALEGPCRRAGRGTRRGFCRTGA